MRTRIEAVCSRGCTHVAKRGVRELISWWLNAVTVAKIQFIFDVPMRCKNRSLASHVHVLLKLDSTARQVHTRSYWETRPSDMLYRPVSPGQPLMELCEQLIR
jgi:hypothetical protein